MWSLKFTIREVVSLGLSPAVIPLIYFPGKEELELSVFVSMAIASYGGMLLVGLPILLGLKRYKLYTKFWIMLSGLLGGALVGIISFIVFLKATKIGISLSDISFYSLIPLMAICAVFGLIVSIVFLLLSQIKLHVQTK